MAISGSLATIRAQVLPHSSFETTFKYLEALSQAGSEANARLMAVPLGESVRVELGDGIFALEQAYLSKPREEGKWESHLKYLDVQVVLVGEEILEACEISLLELSEDLTPAKDLLFYKASDCGSKLRLHAGEAAILFPIDGHMPGLRVTESVLVRKSVVKIPVF